MEEDQIGLYGVPTMCKLRKVRPPGHVPGAELALCSHAVLRFVRFASICEVR